MLPQHGNEDENGRDEDEGESDLRDGPRREGLDIDIRAGALIPLLVPSREGGEENECEEGEDNGDDEQVWEDDGVLERGGNPNKVERVLVH